jgi:hypothetical protein
MGALAEQQVVWWVVRQYAEKAAIDGFAPHVAHLCKTLLLSGWRARANSVVA